MDAWAEALVAWREGGGMEAGTEAGTETHLCPTLRPTRGRTSSFCCRHRSRRRAWGGGVQAYYRVAAGGRGPARPEQAGWPPRTSADSGAPSRAGGRPRPGAESGQMAVAPVRIAACLGWDVHVTTCDERVMPRRGNSQTRLQPPLRAGAARAPAGEERPVTAQTAGRARGRGRVDGRARNGRGVPATGRWRQAGRPAGRHTAPVPGGAGTAAGAHAAAACCMRPAVSRLACRVSRLSAAATLQGPPAACRIRTPHGASAPRPAP